MTQRSELVIDATHSRLSLPWREWIRYRDLLFFLVKREFLSAYTQTLLGPTWLILQPVLTLVVLIAVFSHGVGLSTDGIPAPLFYLSGLIFWNFVSQSVVGISACLKTNVGVFGKVYFPRLLVPMSIVTWKLNAFLIQLLLLAACLVYYHGTKGVAIHPWAALTLLPPLCLACGALALGVGLVIAALSVKYRDLQQVVTLLTQLWMYATPILYPVSILSKKMRMVLYANPLSPIVESFRQTLFSRTAVSGPIFCPWFIQSLVVSILALFFGLVCFQWIEGSFVDTV